LARVYPYFEQAFAAAYSTLPTLQIVSEIGALESATAGLLVENFLNNTNIRYNPTISLAAPATAPNQAELEKSWVRFKSGVWEHATWINGTLLEQLFDISPYRCAVVGAANFPDNERSVAVLASQGSSVALVDVRGRFQTLLDREAILEGLSVAFLSLYSGKSDSAQPAPVVALASGALLAKRRFGDANPHAQETAGVRGPDQS